MHALWLNRMGKSARRGSTARRYVNWAIKSFTSSTTPSSSLVLGNFLVYVTTATVISAYPERNIPPVYDGTRNSVLGINTKKA